MKLKDINKPKTKFKKKKDRKVHADHIRIARELLDLLRIEIVFLEDY